jgi:hypothetical protein
MTTPNETHLKQPRRLTSLVAMSVGLAVVALTVVAQQPEASAPASPAEEVAREILDIQNELGGSIVPDLSPDSLTPPAESFQPFPNESKTRIEHLRDAAWRLDSSAHRLECVELYRQADALRDLAADLRQDARALKTGPKHEAASRKGEIIGLAPPAPVD